MNRGLRDVVTSSPFGYSVTPETLKLAILWQPQDLLL